MSFWDFSLENTGRTQIVSIQYQEQYGRAKKPVFMRVFAVSSVIPIQFVRLGRLMELIGQGVPAGEALEQATGRYGRYEEGVRFIDPRKE